jgi:hypothetical protein
MTSSSRHGNERGSALILALLVLVVLSAGGLLFIAQAELEVSHAVRDRDRRQVLQVAMGGVDIAVGWLNSPDRGVNPMVPTADDLILSQRVGDSDFDGVADIDAPSNGAPDQYQGGRASGFRRLFDKPYRGTRQNTFWGSAANPDVLVRDDPNDPNEYLDEVNALLNPGGDPSLGRIRIEEIRIFAPPVDDRLEARYGIATIQVTALKEQFVDKRMVTTRRTVRVIVHELPFPVPIGSLESEGFVDESGNFGAHWGGTRTEGELDPSKVPTSVPRLSASRQGWEDFSPNAPDLDLTVAGTQNLLTQMIVADKKNWPGFMDPWALFEANGQLIFPIPNNLPHPFPYDYHAVKGLEDDRSLIFQYQDYSFPEVDYDAWKAIAQMPLPNTRYFSFAGWDSADALYQEDGIGPTYTFQQWINLNFEATGTEPAVFFFDTLNGQNPQNGGPGILVPDERISSGDIIAANGQFFTAGFIYLNAEVLKTSGLSSKGNDIYINPPEEPFLDTGIDLDGSGVIGDTPEEVVTIGNGVWDFDLDNDGVSDGERYLEVFGSAEWQVFESSHQFGDEVVPHGGADPRFLADRPHEAFLNFAWPDEQMIIDGDLVPVDFDWELGNARPVGRDLNQDGVLDSTSSLWDIYGGQVILERCNLQGVFYTEGGYDGSGNMVVHGSMFFRSGFEATGSPSIWYNPDVNRGNFPFPEWNFPRVYVSQMDTDP